MVDELLEGRVSLNDQLLGMRQAGSQTHAISDRSVCIAREHIDIRAPSTI